MPKAAPQKDGAGKASKPAEAKKAGEEPKTPAKLSKRPYSIVVWGATGYTGTLLCKQIAETYPVRPLPLARADEQPTLPPVVLMHEIGCWCVIKRVCGCSLEHTAAVHAAFRSSGQSSRQQPGPVMLPTAHCPRLVRL